eukprot:COSAG02_NODE_529_length_20702_cov_43.720555_16_plen_39_part_00
MNYLAALAFNTVAMKCLNPCDQSLVRLPDIVHSIDRAL